jgi:hypothetical protein
MSGILMASSSGLLGFAFWDHEIGPGVSTTETFSGISIGAADPARRVIVAVMTSQSSPPTLLSATIGGIAATIHASATMATGKVYHMSAAVPTGTTADIVLELDAIAVRCEIVVYTDVLGRTLATSSTDTTGTTTIDLDLNVTMDSVTIATGAFAGGNVPVSLTGYTVTDYSNHSGSVTRVFARDPLLYGDSSPKTYQLIASGAPTAVAGVCTNWA